MSLRSESRSGIFPLLTITTTTTTFTKEKYFLNCIYNEQWIEKSLNSFVALQNIYIQLVEEENPDHAETLSNYVSVIDSLKSQFS